MNYQNVKGLIQAHHLFPKPKPDKKYKGPPFDIYKKKCLLNFEKQYTYLIDLNYIQCLKFVAFNITLLFLIKNKIEKNLNQS
jgi:hypothetical protein